MAHALIHVFELAIPGVLLLIQLDLGAGDLAMGRIVMVSALLFGLGALPAGFLVDRLGSKVLLLLCLWGGSLAMLGMAVSPDTVVLTVSAAVLGLALSIYHPAGTALITHALPLSGKVFAVHGMAGNLGVATASGIAGLLGALLGWRWAFVALALAGFALGTRALLLPAPVLHEIRARPGRGKWSAFLMLLVATTFMGMVYRGMTTFLPKFFGVSYASDTGSGTAIGGGLTSIALFVGLGGMYLAGRLIDRGARPATLFLVGAAIQAPVLLAIGFSGSGTLVPLFMGVAFFHFFTQPAGNHMVADFTPARLRGLGYGVYFMMTFGAGSAGAILAGWISERIGLQAVFPALAAVLVPSAIAILVVRWIVRGPRGEPGSANARRVET
jgi:MFS family permease